MESLVDMPVERLAQTDITKAMGCHLDHGNGSHRDSEALNPSRRSIWWHDSKLEAHYL